jgi:putative transposase
MRGLWKWNLLGFLCKEIRMKKSRFSDVQVLSILRQAECGMAVPELCQEHSISVATFCKWRSKFGGVDVSMIADLKVMEDENRRMKKMFAELSVQNELLKEAFGKNNPASSYPAGECLHSPKGLAS